jgi:para-nitrobenzyl esterase
MQSKSTSQILAASPSSSALGSFGPNVDGVIIPQQEGAALASGQFNRVPIMQGTTHDEFRLQVAIGFDLVGNPITAQQYPALVQAKYGANAPSILDQYPLDAYPTPGLAFATLMTDASYSCAARTTDQDTAAYVPTFAYEFDDPNAPPYLLNVSVPGAIHASDVQYIFQPVNAETSGQFTPDQLALSDQMISYWAQFAATGNPNSSTTPPWPSYTASGDNFQSFAPGGSHQTTAFTSDHRCGFWTSLPPS